MITKKDAAWVRAALDRLLPGVVKPGRYVGGEWNMVRKNWESVETRMAFLFPDVYEVGMSNLAIRILCGLVNEDDRFLCERAFAPWPDMEEKMRAAEIPLYALESFHPLRDFDVLGVTLQYELSYTNVLNMLDLSGIPRRRTARDETEGANYPWLMAGGPCAYNPEPLAAFFDLFVLGEGEETLPAVLAVIGAGHKAGLSRDAVRERLAALPGVYVPALYTPGADAAGRPGPLEAKTGAPARVRKAIVTDFDRAYFPERCVVPYNEAVQDRVMLEVMRGCTRGCRFCQAGMIYRPLRERSRETLTRQALASVQATGYEEISLVSLSTGDYSQVNGLLSDLLRVTEGRGVNLSLPSLRLDSFDVEMAASVQKVRKSGLTFAPEAGTQRLRDVINKGVTEEDLLRTARAVFGAGWSSIKLYYMIGLPTETMEDVDGIAAQAERVLAAGRAAGNKGARITVSVSNFVPKAHTPFQWSALEDRASLRAKQAYLRDKFRSNRQIKFLYHDVETSFAEAVLARGDRRVAALLETLVDKGCRFDGWSEWFRPELWAEALKDTGLDSSAYLETGAEPEQPLPWEHIDCGVTTDYLREEARRAAAGLTTVDCRMACTGCGACPEGGAA